LAKTIEAIKIIKFAGIWKELPEEKIRDFGDRIASSNYPMPRFSSVIKN
jgi:hypothetical protein